MGKSGPKLSEAKAEKLRKGVRAIIKANKDLQAAVNALTKSSKSKDNEGQAAQRDLKGHRAQSTFAAGRERPF